MFAQSTWDRSLDKCTEPYWSPYLLASFYPGTMPLGSTLDSQANQFARTFYAATWYAGDQGWGTWDTIDWTRYNLAPLENAIKTAALAAGRSDLNGTKIIALGNPSTQGTRDEPAMVITEVSSITFDEWNAIVANGDNYNGEFHKLRVVF
jgi:hypothetical protein